MVSACPDWPCSPSKWPFYGYKWWLQTILTNWDYPPRLVPPEKLTWQWKMDLLKIYSLLKMGIFHCHVSLLECICSYILVGFSWFIKGCPYTSPWIPIVLSSLFWSMGLVYLPRCTIKNQTNKVNIPVIWILWVKFQFLHNSSNELCAFDMFMVVSLTYRDISTWNPVLTRLFRLESRSCFGAAKCHG